MGIKVDNTSKSIKKEAWNVIVWFENKKCNPKSNKQCPYDMPLEEAQKILYNDKFKTEQYIV